MNSICASVRSKYLCSTTIKCVADNSFFLLKLPSKKTGDGIDDISSSTACWLNICPVIDMRGSALQPVSLRHLWFLIDAGSGAWWRADLWPTSRHHSLGFPCHRNISLSSYSFQLDWTFWRCLTLLPPPDTHGSASSHWNVLSYCRLTHRRGYS